jgi:hypothetical protein
MTRRPLHHRIASFLKIFDANDTTTRWSEALAKDWRVDDVILFKFLHYFAFSKLRVERVWGGFSLHPGWNCFALFQDFCLTILPTNS